MNKLARELLDERMHHEKKAKEHFGSEHRRLLAEAENARRAHDKAYDTIKEIEDMIARDSLDDVLAPEGE